MGIKIYKSKDDILAIYFAAHSSKYRFFHSNESISEINKTNNSGWATAINSILEDCINRKGYKPLNQSPISQIKVAR